MAVTNSAGACQGLSRSTQRNVVIVREKNASVGTAGGKKGNIESTPVDTDAQHRVDRIYRLCPHSARALDWTKVVWMEHWNIGNLEIDGSERRIDLVCCTD